MSERAEGISSSHNKNQLKDFQEKDEYKSLLVVNDSTDVRITLYLYPSWFYFCKVSWTSKIIKPKEDYLHREETSFKYRLFAHFDDEREEKELLGPVKLVEDKLIKVTESLHCIEENLVDHPLEKRICLRKMNFQNELTSSSGKANFYDVLGLDMTEVLNLNTDDQKKAIKKAYHEKIRIWDPDKNFGDGEIAMQILVARETLLDDERRVRYHNETDYDKGWFSIKKYKAIFWPECYTEEQNRSYWKRIGLMALSFGLVGGGIILTALTAGAAAPATVVCGAVFGAGLTGAGMLSGNVTISEDSIVDGINAKKWLAKAGIGLAGGAVTGGAAVGFTAAVAGIGSAALESSAVTFGQYAKIGAGSGASGGVASSLSSDGARKFVDGEEVTWMECAGHAMTGAVVGWVAGALGGLATNGIVDRQTTAGSAALEGEMVEQAAIMTGARRFGYPLAQSIARSLTESGTEALMGTASDFIEERLDDSVENQHPMKHAKNGAGKVGKTIVSGAVDVATAAIIHAKNELKIQKKMKGGAFEAKDEQTCRQSIRHMESAENREHLINWKRAKDSGGYRPIDETRELREETGKSTRIYETNREINSDNESYGARDEETAEYPEEGTIRYKSEGAWISKMVVTYSLNGEQIEEETRGSGNVIRIPLNAKHIEVKFQVRRPLWGDIMKYDRFEKKWQEPYEPHVFLYKKPPLQRTFTISGSLWWEAVMRVSDEYHEETGE